MICECMYIYIYTYNVYTLIHTYLHKYINTYIHTYIHTYRHTDRQTDIHTYIHTLHIYMCIYIYMYIGLRENSSMDRPARDRGVWIGLDHLRFGMDRGYGSACGFRVWIGALHFDLQPYMHMYPFHFLGEIGTSWWHFIDFMAYAPPSLKQLSWRLGFPWVNCRVNWPSTFAQLWKEEHFRRVSNTNK